MSTDLFNFQDLKLILEKTEGELVFNSHVFQQLKKVKRCQHMSIDNVNLVTQFGFFLDYIKKIIDNATVVKVGDSNFQVKYQDNLAGVVEYMLSQFPITNTTLQEKSLKRMIIQMYQNSRRYLERIPSKEVRSQINNLVWDLKNNGQHSVGQLYYILGNILLVLAPIQPAEEMKMLYLKRKSRERIRTINFDHLSDSQNMKIQKVSLLMLNYLEPRDIRKLIVSFTFSSSKNDASRGYSADSEYIRYKLSSEEKKLKYLRLTEKLSRKLGLQNQASPQVISGSRRSSHLPSDKKKKSLTKKTRPKKIEDKAPNPIQTIQSRNKYRYMTSDSDDVEIVNSSRRNSLVQRTNKRVTPSFGKSDVFEFDAKRAKKHKADQ